MIHILAIEPGDYHQLMHKNVWLHTLPDCTTFEDAVRTLKRWDAWEAVPESVRRHLLKADPRQETVKAEEFLRFNFRIFGVMPGHRQTGKIHFAMKKAEELGFKPYFLAEQLWAIEASQAGIYMAAVARTVERTGQPFEPPCAIFSSGEMVVAVGNERGMGGRNQEFALSVAQRIAGSKNIVIGSVDTDGTDGPGDQFTEGPQKLPCLTGGIVDGETVAAAKQAGVDIGEAIKRHNTTPALWKLNSGVVATPNISLIDLTVALVLGREQISTKEVA
jgi:glycerate-2-kinase